MRRLTGGDLRPLLDRMVIVIAPIYNVDGNEGVDVMNRTAQYGPIAGVGRRENIKGLDLNRDYMKLESAEARALAAAFTAWDPHLVVDLHTTNGSYHGYHLTQSIPLNLSLSAKTLDYHRETMMPAIMKSLEAKHKVRAYYYGNFGRGNARAGRAAPLERLRPSAARGPELRRLPQPADDPLRGLLVSVVQAPHRGHRAVRRRDSEVRRRPPRRDRRADEVARRRLDEARAGIGRDAARRRVRAEAAAQAGRDPRRRGEAGGQSAQSAADDGGHRGQLQAGADAGLRILRTDAHRAHGARLRAADRRVVSADRRQDPPARHRRRGAQGSRSRPRSRASSSKPSPSRRSRSRATTR